MQNWRGRWGIAFTALFVCLACTPQGRPSSDAGVTFGSGVLDGAEENDATSFGEDSGSSSTTGDTGSTTGDTSSTTGTPLACDPGFTVTPTPPGTGTLTTVGFTDPQPLAFVDLQVSGPGAATISWSGITSNDPWTWNWTVTDLSPGVWTFSFGSGEDWVLQAICEVEVLDTGEPPAPPMGACDGKVCGDPDGMGGVCDSCPMEGECLDPPSPYGPGGLGDWSCLDTAMCNGEGSCRIWCPGEPCNEAEHPDGCPQGVETCWVDANIESYEEACKSCCESRHHAPLDLFACWDDAFNLCRHPYDCGLPLW